MWKDEHEAVTRRITGSSFLHWILGRCNYSVQYCEPFSTKAISELRVELSCQCTSSQHSLRIFLLDLKTERARNPAWALQRCCYERAAFRFFEDRSLLLHTSTSGSFSAVSTTAVSFGMRAVSSWRPKFPSSPSAGPSSTSFCKDMVLVLRM